MLGWCGQLVVRHGSQRDIDMQSATGCEVFWYMVAMRETAKRRAICRIPGEIMRIRDKGHTLPRPVHG
jgi:hypothetical protein